jgi:hypothetical protein
MLRRAWGKAAGARRVLSWLYPLHEGTSRVQQRRARSHNAGTQLTMPCQLHCCCLLTHQDGCMAC